ncbi:hypothetical protein GQ600_21213 [Phytophthora cactorum]|nr:hypothetical protein GQ600_21213 [Phytophthora cactorum]
MCDLVLFLTNELFYFFSCCEDVPLHRCVQPDPRVRITGPGSPFSRDRIDAQMYAVDWYDALIDSGLSLCSLGACAGSRVAHLGCLRLAGNAVLLPGQYGSVDSLLAMEAEDIMRLLHNFPKNTSSRQLFEAISSVSLSCEEITELLAGGKLWSPDEARQVPVKYPDTYDIKTNLIESEGSNQPTLFILLRVDRLADPLDDDGDPQQAEPFNQLRVSDDLDSDDGSAEERQQERKEKQKQKKKSRNKKKSSDSAQLKDLAFVSVSKPKKSKSKKNKAVTNTQPQSPAGSPVEEVPAANGLSEEKEEVAEPKRSLADMIKTRRSSRRRDDRALNCCWRILTVMLTVAIFDIEIADPRGAQSCREEAAACIAATAQEGDVTSPPKQQKKQQQQSAALSPVPAAAPPTASAPQSSSEMELGAVYTPSHITITRVDGQMKRTVAVTDVMDQLLRYTQHNAQLLMVQEQLGNEVTMFRQMCLNLQAELCSAFHHLSSSSTMVGTMNRLKNKLRSSRLHKKEGAWALDEDSLRLKQTQDDDPVRFDRSTTLADTVNVTDDVEEMFYGRSTSNTSSDMPQYRTTEQIRGNNMTLSALHEDAETPSNASNVSSSFSQFSATTPSNYAASTPGNFTSTYHGFNTVQSTTGTSRAVTGASSLEVLEVKEEVKAIRREVMNELHVTRYDVLKELALLKGAIAQLTATQQSSPPSVSSTESSSSDTLSPDERAALTRQTSTKTSQATRDRLAASRSNIHKTPPPAARASVRLTQLAPVADNALSKPLNPQQINEMFPLIDFTSELAAHARGLTPGSRTWALTRVEEWLDARFNVGHDTLLAVVGEGGTGKSAFCGTVAQQFRGNLLAAHSCQFDRKSKSSPRNVLLSMVHQLVDNLPSFKNQLARLNLKYVLEETDPFLLAGKVLVDPLNAVEEPMHATFILVDGIDQCAAGSNGRNELLEFFAQVIPQLPSWVGFLVSSKPSSKLAKRLPVSSRQERSFRGRRVFDCRDIARNFSDDDVAEAKKVLKKKSGGNFAYLEFTKQALSHPGMAAASKEGAVPLGVLHELPETLYDIYAEIFEDKFGQGRARVWGKAKPLLQLVVGAAAGPYSPVTEEQAKEHFNLTAEDLRMLRRSFVDLVAVKHGAYRIESSALCAWLSDPARSEEQFYFSIDDALQALRKMRRVGSSGDSGSSSDGKASHTSSRASSRVKTSSKPHQHAHTRHQPRASPDYKPVGILKRGKL